MKLTDLGTRIREQREKRGLKQADLAHALQISAQAVSKWERGGNAPDIVTLPQLCKLLGVSADWLLGRFAPDADTFPATVFCSDMTGFARRAARLSPRDLAVWINGLFHQVTEAVLRHDGVPVKYVGDGFLGFFSGPRHADRALEAARLARTLVTEAGLGIVLHAGPIFLGAIGHRDYARPDILGETVNTAFLALGWVAHRFPSRVGVTDEVVRQLESPWPGKKLRRFRPRGAAASIPVYEPSW